MRMILKGALGAFVVLGAASCGGNDTASKTVTVPAETVTAAAVAPTTTESPEPADDASAQTKSAGPPLPAGVIGIDGSYLLKSVKSDSQRGYIRDKFGYYEERSNATTKCDGAGCSVTFRLGLNSGGFKSFTLTAAPGREGTYIGTAKAQAECITEGGDSVPTRERVAVRGGAVKDVNGRQVASRLSVYVTTTAVKCGNDPAKIISLLRGPRQP